MRQLRFTCLALVMSIAFVSFTHAYEAIYEPTEVGHVVVRDLPAATALVTRVDGPYFPNANTLFRRLFAYIQRNGIAMTVPVEARMEPGEMLFYVGAADAHKCVTNDPLVQVVVTSPRRVAALAARGGYTQSNFEETADALRKWLAAHPEYRTNGAPYGVYWHGPFRPWFLKRYEVHVPVAREP